MRSNIRSAQCWLVVRRRVWRGWWSFSGRQLNWARLTSHFIRIKHYPDNASIELSSLSPQYPVPPLPPAGYQLGLGIDSSSLSIFLFPHLQYHSRLTIDLSKITPASQFTILTTSTHSLVFTENQLRLFFMIMGFTNLVLLSGAPVTEAVCRQCAFLALGRSRYREFWEVLRKSRARRRNRKGMERRPPHTRRCHKPAHNKANATHKRGAARGGARGVVTVRPERGVRPTPKSRETWEAEAEDRAWRLMSQGTGPWRRNIRPTGQTTTEKPAPIESGTKVWGRCPRSRGDPWNKPVRNQWQQSARLV